VILDTHALLWIDRNDPTLGREARQRIEVEWRAGQVAVSAITFWEVAMLAERGRIALPMPVALWREDWIKAGLVEIPVDGRIALLSTQLENLHRDPADRFIMATAIDRNTALMTADRLILDWAGALARIPADV
jgi:PIN domain nuclease of toxin-antitoxin system